MRELERIREALRYISPHERDIWLRIGMAVKSELGEDGFDIWSEWSQQVDSYNERDARDAVDVCAKGHGIS